MEAQMFVIWMGWRKRPWNSLRVDALLFIDGWIASHARLFREIICSLNSLECWRNTWVSCRRDYGCGGVGILLGPHTGDVLGTGS